MTTRLGRLVKTEVDANGVCDCCEQDGPVVVNVSPGSRVTRICVCCAQDSARAFYDWRGVLWVASVDSRKG